MLSIYVVQWTNFSSMHSDLWLALLSMKLVPPYNINNANLFNTNYNKVIIIRSSHHQTFIRVAYYDNEEKNIAITLVSWRKTTYFVQVN